MKRFLGFSLIAMIAMTTMVTTSCSKYEEGSKFTLLSKKARLVNVWTLTGATSDGTDVMSFMPAVKLDIKKDDTYALSFTISGLTTTETGTWAFSSDKANVILTAADNSVVTWKILMLKNKDLKVQDADNTTTVDIYTFKGE